MKKTFFICDACGEATDNPHKARMKEFRHQFTYSVSPRVISTTIHKKIHICDKCFKGLKIIAEKI